MRMRRILIQILKVICREEGNSSRRERNSSFAEKGKKIVQVPHTKIVRFVNRYLGLKMRDGDYEKKNNNVRRCKSYMPLSAWKIMATKRSMKYYLETQAAMSIGVIHHLHNDFDCAGTAQPLMSSKMGLKKNTKKSRSKGLL